MEPAAIEIVICTLSLVYFAFLSIIKSVFSYAVNCEQSLKNPDTKSLAKKITRLYENRNVFTAVISLGKTAAASLFSIMLYRLFSLWIDPAFVAPAAVLTAVVLLAFPGYTIPKAAAAANSEQYMGISYIFYKINYLFAPAAYLMGVIYRGILNLLKFDEKLSFLTEEEKERLNGDSEHGEMLDQEEQTMIRNIFEFGETTVREIMVPRIDMTALNISADFNTVLRTIYEQGHSRIPIYSETIDMVVGVLYAKDILRWISSMNGSFDPSAWDMSEIMKKPYFVPMNKKLDDLMTDMKANQSHLVIVVDEYGGTAGICSLEDVLEEIVGEIRDEYDEQEGEEISLVADRTYLVDPHMELDTLAEKISYKLELGETEYSTVGGLFYHEFGDVPSEGTSFDFSGLTMTITKMDHQRIEEIQIVVPEMRETVENS